MVIVIPLFLERMLCLLPAEKKTALTEQERFGKFYHLKCDNIWADFQEDLEFKFSRVCRSVISSFVGKKANSTALTNYSQQVTMLCIVACVIINGLI